MEESLVDRCIRRAGELEQEKSHWLPLFQSLAQIFLTRKMDFTSSIAPGAFLQEEIFNNTGQFSAFLAASVFLSMLWPDSARTFVLKPTRRLREVPGIDEYFEFLTEEMYAAMDNPRAGLQAAFMECFIDQVVFGTGGVGAFAGPDEDGSLPVVYKSWGIKGMCIAENAQGFVDTIYYKEKLTVRQAVQEYGPENVHPKVRELIAADKLEEKIEILYVLEPKKPEAGKEGVAAMKVRSAHIDVTNKHLLRDSGYEEMPVAVGRLIKTVGEPYGRSFGMIAQPDALSLNSLSEDVIAAVEKQLDPPLGLLDDGRLGGGTVDTSAHALSVFNTSGRIGNEKPIFPLFTVGEIQSSEKLKAELKEAVTQAFALDRLLDLNNQTQMTAFETSVRNRMRGEALSSTFAREDTEIVTPTINRTFNELWRQGRLGVVTKGIGAKLRRLWATIVGDDRVIVPDAVAQAVAAGLKIYEIDYISPAKRFMQSEKLQGLFTAMDGAVALAPIAPGIMDNFDTDEYARSIVEYSGAPRRIIRPAADVKTLRAAAAQVQNASMQIEAGKGIADIGLKAAQARQAMGTNGTQGRT